MARVTPLTVATVSAVLLVAVLAVDATMNRTYKLQVQATDGWKTFAESPTGEYEYARPYASYAPQTIANNSSVTFRVFAENGYPWALDKPYEVFYQGSLVASGTIEAPARGSGTAEFTLDVERLVAPYYGAQKPIPDRPGISTDIVFLELRIAGEDDSIAGEVYLQEVSS